MVRQENKDLRRAGFAGNVFGQLPLVLASIGVGSLGTAAMMFKPHPLLEVAGLLAAVTGIVLVVALRVA